MISLNFSGEKSAGLGLLRLAEVVEGMDAVDKNQRRRHWP